MRDVEPMACQQQLLDWILGGTHHIVSSAVGNCCRLVFSSQWMQVLSESALWKMLNGKGPMELAHSMMEVLAEITRN
jgi:hypothetical protein